MKPLAIAILLGVLAAVSVAQSNPGHWADQSTNKSGLLNSNKVALFFQNPMTRQAAAWRMNGPRVTSTKMLGKIPPGTWQIVSFIDLDRDGMKDIVWEDTVSRRVIIWFMDKNLNVRRTQDLVSRIEEGWFLKGMGNIDHSGGFGMLWVNAYTGSMVQWLLDPGLRLVSWRTIGVAPSGWTIVGAADMNNDGLLDIIWQGGPEVKRMTAIWYMNHLGNVASTALTGSSGPAWKMLAVTELLHDTPTFIFQQLNTGELHAWYLDHTGEVVSAQRLGNGGDFVLVHAEKF